MSGYGTFKHTNGTVYKGQWKDGRQHGSGIEIWVDSAQYNGEYIDGKKEGCGAYYWADGS